MTRAPGTPDRRQWAAVIAAASFVLFTEHVGYAVGAPLSFLVLDTTLGLVFVLAGAVAWQRRPASATGPILVASAALWSIGSYSPTGLEPVWALGYAFEGYYDVALAVLALVFPAGRLGGVARLAALTMAAAFLLRSLGRLLLQDPPWTYSDAFRDGPVNPFAILESRAAFEATEVLTSALIAIVALVIVAMTMRRLAGSTALARAVVAPVLAATVVALVSAAFDAADTAWSTATGSPLLPVPESLSGILSWLLFGARALVPLGFLIGTLRLRSAGGPLGELAHGLEREAPPDELDAALRAYIENEALANELTRQLAELRASRARIVSTGDAERRRIERALHDGAQQHLTAISIRLDEARRLLDEQRPDVVLKLEQTAVELRDAIHELRELARGIHPAVLTDAGLGPAVATLARRSTVPVDLSVQLDRRLPLPIEVTAYYVVAEALTNLARSAHARRASVVIAREAEGVLIVVSDDGVGGADPLRGSGIVGLQDRVRALGGHVLLDSPAGGGTRLEAWLPCV